MGLLTDLGQWGIAWKTGNDLATGVYHIRVGRNCESSNAKQGPSLGTTWGLGFRVQSLV